MSSMHCWLIRPTQLTTWKCYVSADYSPSSNVHVYYFIICSFHTFNCKTYFAVFFSFSIPQEPFILSWICCCHVVVLINWLIRFIFSVINVLFLCYFLLASYLCLSCSEIRILQSLYYFIRHSTGSAHTLSIHVCLILLCCSVVVYYILSLEPLSPSVVYAVCCCVNLFHHLTSMAYKKYSMYWWKLIRCHTGTVWSNKWQSWYDWPIIESGAHTHTHTHTHTYTHTHTHTHINIS